MQDFESQTKNSGLDPVRTSLLNTKDWDTNTYFSWLFGKSRDNIYEASEIKPDPL